MNLRYTITTASLALAGLVWTTSAAKAAGTAGDLILSFRYSDNSNTNDLEIDLGQSTNFTTTAILNLTYGANYYAGASTGGLAASDLSAVFGSNWNAQSLLVWDVAGHTGTTQTNTHLFATQPSSGPTASAPGSSLTSPGGRIGNLTSGFQGAASAVTVTSPEAWAAAITPASQDEYTGALRNATPTVNTDFGFFNVSTESGVTSSGSVSLELYNYGPSSRTDLGTFTLDSVGDFTFNGVASTPEPTTFSLLGMAAVGLVGLRRRRALAKA